MLFVGRILIPTSILYAAIGRVLTNSLTNKLVSPLFCARPLEAAGRFRIKNQLRAVQYRSNTSPARRFSLSYSVVTPTVVKFAQNRQ